MAQPYSGVASTEKPIEYTNHATWSSRGLDLGVNQRGSNSMIATRVTSRSFSQAQSTQAQSAPAHQPPRTSGYTHCSICCGSCSPSVAATYTSWIFSDSRLTSCQQSFFPILRNCHGHVPLLENGSRSM